MRQGAYRFLSSVLSREVGLGHLSANPALGTTTRRRASTTAEQRPRQSVTLPSRRQEMDLAMAVPDMADRLLLLVLMWQDPVSPKPPASFPTGWTQPTTRSTST